MAEAASARSAGVIGAWLLALVLGTATEARTEHAGAGAGPDTRGVSRIGAPVPEVPGARARTEVEAALSQGRSAALVIGISAFESPGWNDLPGVEDEIPEVARALAVHGFDVDVVVPDAESGELRLDRRDLRDRIRQFLARRGTDPETRLLIYVATHGYADPGGEGEGHLVASDSLAPEEDGFEDSTYSVRDLARDLGTIRARHVMLLFNSCFSGAMVPSMAVPGTRGAGTVPDLGRLSATTTDWVAELLGREARLVLTAGSAGQEVPDRDNPFVRAVTGGLYGDADLDGDGVILGTELAMHVRASVARETRELGAANDPVIAFLPRCRADGACQDVSSLELGIHGDFLFLSPRGAAPAEQGDAEARLAAMNSRLRTSEFVDCIDCPRMVRLPATPGTPALALSRTEVTEAQWQACYRELGCRRFLPPTDPARPDLPVAGLTWQDALDFAEWVDDARRPGSPCSNYRLPSVEEWQRGAQAGGSSRYPWGDLPREGRVHCDGCAGGGAGPVPAGSLPANAFGLHETLGNLWEWVETGDACAANELYQRGICAPGLVAGGSHATNAAVMSSTLTGTAPRTVALGDEAFAWPTVGMRLACTVADEGAGP